MALERKLPLKRTAQTLQAATIVAFGFKHGVPDDLNVLFDVRFLRNPNYEPELEPLTGMDDAVAAYIESDPATAPFLERLFRLLDFLVPRLTSGENPVRIGIGCTGGHHRSVYVARRLREHLEAQGAPAIALELRDVER